MQNVLTHKNINLKKIVDNTCCLLEKQIQQLLLNYEALIFCLKADYHLTETLFS